MDAKLKECPFCGTSKSLYIRNAEGFYKRQAYYIACDNCGAHSRATDKGDHVEIWNERAIAPPVAAGSVDKGKIDDLLVALSIAAVDVSRGGHSDIHRDAALELINAIDAWGAQQREAGRQSEAAHILHLTHERDLARASTSAYADRAEKAEKQWDSWMACANHWQGRAEKAEARVKELEEDAMRWRHLRDLDHDLTGTPGQPCVALPNGMDSGYYLTGPEAVFAVDASMAEHSGAIDPSDTPC